MAAVEVYRLDGTIMTRRTYELPAYLVAAGWVLVREISPHGAKPGDALRAGEWVRAERGEERTENYPITAAKGLSVLIQEIESR